MTTAATTAPQPAQSMIAALGDTRGNYQMRDVADGMGNFRGRVAQQRFFATLREVGVRDKARARGLEYTH